MPLFSPPAPTPNLVTVVAASGASQTLSAAGQLDPVFDVTLTAACALSLAASVIARLQTITVILRQDATGGRVVTLPTVAWPYGAPPALNTKVGLFDVLQFSTADSGATWLGSVVGIGMASATLAISAFTGTIYGGATLAVSGTYTGTAPANLDYSFDGGSWTTLAAGAATITNGTFSFSTTAPATAGAHTMQVRATNSTGEVSPAQTLTVAAASAPSAVTVAGSAGNNVVNLTLQGTANGAAVQTFDVLRGTSASGPFTKIGSATPSSTPTSGVTTAAYADTTAANGSGPYYYETTANSTAGNTTSAVSAGYSPTSAATHALVLSGANATEGATTPASATNDAYNTGGNYLSIEVGLNFPSYAVAGNLVSKWYPTTANTAADFILHMNTNGIPELVYWDLNKTAHTHTCSAALSTAGTANNPLYLRVEINASTSAVTDGYGVSRAAGTVTFLTSPDRSTWTVLGSVISGATAGVIKNDSGNPLAIGGNTGNTNPAYAGKITKVVMKNAAGTILANPDFTAQATGTTSFTDTAATPNTWTVNGTASIS